MSPNVLPSEAKGRRFTVPERLTPATWEDRRKQSGKSAFEQFFDEWRQEFSELKKTAGQLLYEAEAAPQLFDLWMHRILVSHAIIDLQRALLEHFGNCFELECGDPLPEEVSRAEKEMAEVIDLLHRWHGSPESQRDVPSELLESMAEALAGETENFEDGCDARTGKGE